MKYLSVNPILLLILLLLIGGATYPQPSTTLSRISVSGNTFVNEEGAVVVLKGLDTSDPDKLSREGHWNRRYFEEMKNWGANIVRFPVHPRAWREQGQENYLKLLDQGVQWAQELGMYVISDRAADRWDFTPTRQGRYFKEALQQE